MKQALWLLTGSLLFSAMAPPALAQSASTSQTPYTVDSKKAHARYEEDLKLCNDEPSSNARLQCRRDAKAEYDKALAAAQAHTVPSAQATCTECGTVVSIAITQKEGESSGVGMLAGGAAGAVLGNQIGGGIGKDLATIAGAVGGAYAGKKIEGKMKTRDVWTVAVRYTDGHQRHFEFEQDPGLQVGDPVKNSGNTIVRD